MLTTFRSIITCAAMAWISSSLWAQQLSALPSGATPLQLVRLHYSHVGCTNPDSVKVSQQANHITVQVDRLFFPDCGTILGYFEEFTLGRLPAGDYDAELVVNPPPPTLGPSVSVGTVHFTVAQLPPTGSLSPHENYSDMWWNPREAGWALNLMQSSDQLFAVWVVYDSASRPTWYTMLSGSWVRDATNGLHYSGTLFKTSGPYWAGVYDPNLLTITSVGTADFRPLNNDTAQFRYNLEGVSASKQIQRLRFQ